MLNPELVCVKPMIVTKVQLPFYKQPLTNLTKTCWNVKLLRIYNYRPIT